MPLDSTHWVEDDTLVLLRKARALVAAGWCQHHPNQGRQVCIMTALHITVWGTHPVNYWEAHRRQMELAERMHTLLPAEWSEAPLYSWNDAPGRTKREVLALFDRAIEAAG